MEDTDKGLRRLLGALERLQGRGSSEAAVAELRLFFSRLSNDTGPTRALLHDKSCMPSRAAEVARRCCVGLYALLGSAAKGGGSLGVRLVTAQLLLLLTSLSSSSKAQQQQQAGGPPPPGGTPLDLLAAFTYELEGLSKGPFGGLPATEGPPNFSVALSDENEAVLCPWEVLAATPSGWGPPGGPSQKGACSAVLPSCLAKGPGSQMSLYSPNQLCCLLLLLLQLQGPHVLEANVKTFTHFVAGDKPSAAVSAAAAGGASTEQQQQQQQQQTAPPVSPRQLFAFGSSTKQQQQQQLAASLPCAAAEGRAPPPGTPRGARPQLLAVRQLSLLCILRLLEVSPRPVCCFKEEIQQLEKTFELLLLRCSSTSTSSKKHKSTLSSWLRSGLLHVPVSELKGVRRGAASFSAVRLSGHLDTSCLHTPNQPSCHFDGSQVPNRLRAPQRRYSWKHRVREEALFRLMHFGFLDKAGSSSQQQQPQQQQQRQRSASREEALPRPSPTGGPVSPGGPPEWPPRFQGGASVGPVRGLKGSFFRSVSRYCLRVLQQAELQQQQQVGGCSGTAAGGVSSADSSSSSSSSSLRLGRNAFVSCAHLERQLVDAAALEAVRILFLLSPADRNIQQQAFAAIKRLAERPASVEGSLRSFHLSAFLFLRFFSSSASLGLVGGLEHNCFVRLLPTQLPDPTSSFLTLTAAFNARQHVQSGTLFRYFPSIFIIAAFHPRSAGSLLRFLIPSLVSGGSYGVVLNALLDLPLTAAFLERWGLQGPPEGSCCPLLQAAARYLLRTEADGTLGLWEGRTQDELQRLLRLCEGLPATPRVSAVCKLLPLSIDALLREALESPSPEPRAEVFRVLLSRFLLLYPLGFFEEDFRKRAVKALVALVQQDPTLLLQQQQPIVAAIMQHLSPKGAPLAQALCWAVGALLTPELLQQHQGLAALRLPFEIVTRYFEALEAVAYGAVAPLSPRGRPPLFEGPQRAPQGAPQGLLEGKPAESWSRMAASPRPCSEISIQDGRLSGPLQGPPGEEPSGAGNDLPPLLFCVCVAVIAHLALRFPPLRPRAVLCLTAVRTGVHGENWRPLLSRISFSLRLLADAPLTQKTLNHKLNQAPLFPFQLWDWLRQSEQEVDGESCPGTHRDTLVGCYLPSLGKPADKKAFFECNAGFLFTKAASSATASTRADSAIAGGGLVARGLLQRLRKSREVVEATREGVEVSGPLV
ncbi:hypothetical protein Esti_006036 [Eimeria stiedai]